jgi:hypothetical protein
MKSTLSFGLMLATAGLLSACSDDEGEPRDTAGASGAAGAGNAGSSGAAGTATAGSSGASGSAGSGGGSTAIFGPALNIQPIVDGEGAETATVADLSGTSGINGAALPQISSANTATVNHTAVAGSLCLEGSVLPVPNDTSYGTHWGTEVNVDLNRGEGGGAPAADAGAGDAGAGDAGGGGLEPSAPWDPEPGNVIGFAFTFMGQGEAGAGVPAAIRFKGVPNGANPAMDNFCYTILAPTHGQQEVVLFDQVTRDCWVDGNPGIIAEPFPAGYDGTLLNMGWQVNADVGDGHMFDFCITDFKPVLSE